MADQQPPTQSPPPGQPPQQPPQWAPPPQQPQWGAPPPGAWGQPGYMAPPPRPTGVTIGSIWLIVLGILWILGGAACAIGGGVIGGLAGTTTSDGTTIPGLGALGGAIAVIGIIVIIIGVLQIASGAGALGGRGWARWIGIVVSIIFVIFGILGLLAALGSLNQNGGGFSLAFQLVILVGYGFTAYAFLTASQFFGYRR